MLDTQDSPTCDRCGSSCYWGYEIRYHGNPDPETGYRDQELVCSQCLDDQDSDDERYAEADRKLTRIYEEGGF